MSGRKRRNYFTAIKRRAIEACIAVQSQVGPGNKVRGLILTADGPAIPSFLATCLLQSTTVKIVGDKHYAASLRDVKTYAWKQKQLGARWRDEWNKMDENDLEQQLKRIPQLTTIPELLMTCIFSDNFIRHWIHDEYANAFPLTICGDQASLGCFMAGLAEPWFAFEVAQTLKSKRRMRTGRQGLEKWRALVKEYTGSEHIEEAAEQGTRPRQLINLFAHEYWQIVKQVPWLKSTELGCLSMESQAGRPTNRGHEIERYASALKKSAQALSEFIYRVTSTRKVRPEVYEVFKKHIPDLELLYQGMLDMSKVSISNYSEEESWVLVGHLFQLSSQLNDEDKEYAAAGTRLLDARAWEAAHVMVDSSSSSHK